MPSVEIQRDTRNMSAKITEAFCEYLKTLSYPVFIQPSRNNETGKVEVAIYIYEIEQTDEKVKEILKTLQETSLV